MITTEQQAIFIKSCLNLTQTELNYALVKSCIKGNLDEVKILLTSPEFRFHADIHCGKDSPFERASMNNNKELLNFLIFDMNIKRTVSIDNIIEQPNNEFILKMFIARDLKKN